MNAHDDDDFEFQLIMTMLHAMKEYVSWSLVFDGVIDLSTMDSEEADAVAMAEFETILAPIQGNKANADIPFTNQDAHAVLDAVARWRLDKASDQRQSEP